MIDNVKKDNRQKSLNSDKLASNMAKIERYKKSIDMVEDKISFAKKRLSDFKTSNS